MKHPHHNLVKLLSIIGIYGASHSVLKAEILSVGIDHACAINIENKIRCWGYNGKGQTNVPMGTFQSVSAGGSHTCGIKTDGSAVCWGDNKHGQINVPEGTFKDISAGMYHEDDRTHTCGVKTDGSVMCWGNNEFGQCNAPEGSFEQVSAGGYHSCGVKTDGHVVCWGKNDSGQSTPSEGTFKHVDAGGVHTCGSRTDGSIACWGYNGDGRVNFPEGNFESVSAGKYHTCGVKTDGTVTCWGFNGSGQSTPPEGTFEQVSAGYQSCGIKTDGSIVCWGKGEAIIPPAGLQVITTSCLATYSNNTRQANLPCLDIPLYLDPTGQALSSIINPSLLGLYSAVLEIPFGFSDFEVKSLSLRRALSEPNSNHANFDPDTGTLTVPKIRVPSLTPWLNDSVFTPGPKLNCHATLQQSVLRPEVLSLTDFGCAL